MSFYTMANHHKFTVYLLNYDFKCIIFFLFHIILIYKIMLSVIEPLIN